MPIAPRISRALVALCLAAASLLAVAPRGAAALEPPRPLPSYRPAFVTETDTRPWIDCLWASGAMLLDKWTNGEMTASHGRLRRLSGDTHRGSTLANLKVAYARLGIDLPYSPDGGARITWGGLLNQLAHGGGAVLLGDDTRLPRWYGRWDARFWKGKSKSTSHALYVERYDRRRGRVWLMDPLARGDWNGEWISVWALRRFAWTSGGLVYAAMTPRARPAPFAKVKASGPSLIGTPTALEATWHLQAPRRWRYPGADVHATFKRAEDPLLAAVALPVPSPDLPTLDPMQAIVGEDAESGTGTAPATPRSPTVDLSRRTLRVTAALPVAPGTYVARLRLTDRRFGRTVVDTGEAAVFVPGPRQATIGVAVGGQAAGAGSLLDLKVTVSNTGADTWAEAAGVGPASKARSRNARLVATWIRTADADGTALDAAAVAPDPVVLARVPLASGRRVVARGSIQAPSTTGRWALVVDVVDDIDGSYAALGSRPGAATIDIVDAPGAFEAPGSTRAFTVLDDDGTSVAGAS